jgi:hypothetical protein
MSAPQSHHSTRPIPRSPLSPTARRHATHPGVGRTSLLSEVLQRAEEMKKREGSVTMLRNGREQLRNAPSSLPRRAGEEGDLRGGGVTGGDDGEEVGSDSSGPG